MEAAREERALEADAAAAELVVDALVVVLEKGACEVELAEAEELRVAAVPEEVVTEAEEDATEEEEADDEPEVEEADDEADDEDVDDD